MSTPARNRILVLCDRLAVTAAILTGFAALTRLWAREWPFELACHFQVQYLVVALLATVFLVCRGRLRLSAMALVCTAAAATAVVPFVWRGGGGAAYAALPEAVDHLRILHANVLSHNRRWDDLLALIEAEDPDVVVLQEVNRRWMNAMAPLAGDYPHQASGLREDNFGIAIFSRLPFTEHDLHDLGEARLPTLSVTVVVDGRPLSLLVTHPKTPVKPGPARLRNDQLDKVSALAQTLPRPLVVVGDLNTTMWSPWYRDLCESNELTNARDGFGVLASWPVACPSLARLPIDHCLVSPRVSVTGCRLGPEVGSDHLPLIVDLAVP